ncbi:FAS1-like dehydratase domain-containing protein [Blastococcus sp. SYSU D00695]
MADNRFPVEAGHVLMFRRAIGDPAAAYDPEALAPPTFTVAASQFEPQHSLRPTPGEPWFGSGRTPSGTAGSGGSSEGGASEGPAESTLHAEQHFTYHRPVRAGDVLTATSRPGETWTKEGKRGGTLRFSEYVTEFRDADGELVVTSRGVSVTPSQPPVGGQG